MLSFEYKHFLRHIFKDVIYNFFLSIKLELTKYVKGNEINPPTGYQLVFEDNFTSQLDTNNWGYGQPWGEFHPDYPHQRYDTDGSFSYTKDGKLNLEIRNSPKKFNQKNLPEYRKTDKLPQEFTIPTAIGMIHSKESWRYGWFEATVKLPVGQSYWNAFWLAGVNTWPPEIDIFEAYTHFGPNYEAPTILRKYFLSANRRIRPNLHYGDVPGNKKHYVAFDVPVHKATQRYVQYAVLWEKDKIEIYFDGKKVLRCTDPEILKYYNRENSQQQIILNHGQHYAYKYRGKLDESIMKVKSVKVFKKKVK